MRKRKLSLVLAAVVCAGCAGGNKPVYSTPPGPSIGLGTNAPAPPSPPPPPAVEKKTSTTKKARPPQVIVTPENSLSGKVVTYNDAGRFVVLDFPGGKMPAVDQRMFVYRGGLKVGEVKVNSWQRNRYVVADLIAGEGKSGDEVRDR